MSESPVERLAQIVAFATIEAVEAGLLDRYLHRIQGAVILRIRVKPAPVVGETEAPTSASLTAKESRDD